jgi:hypothetical protein
VSKIIFGKVTLQHRKGILEKSAAMKRYIGMKNMTAPLFILSSKPNF